MPKKLDVAFSDSTYEDLIEYAEKKGMTPKEVVVDLVEKGLAGIFVWEKEEESRD